VIQVDVSGLQAVLRDEGSLNGCFINNVRVQGQRELLTHGDNVRFGFEQRIWSVDCMSKRAAQKLRRKPPPAGVWEYGARVQE